MWSSTDDEPHHGVVSIVTKLSGGGLRLHSADYNAVMWPKDVMKAHVRCNRSMHHIRAK